MRKDADEQEKKRELEAVGKMATTLQNIFIAHNTKVCRSDTTCARSKSDVSLHIKDEYGDE